MGVGLDKMLHMGMLRFYVSHNSVTYDPCDILNVEHILMWAIYVSLSYGFIFVLRHIYVT